VPCRRAKAACSRALRSSADLPLRNFFFKRPQSSYLRSRGAPALRPQQQSLDQALASQEAVLDHGTLNSIMIYPSRLEMSGAAALLSSHTTHCMSACYLYVAP